MRTINYTLLEAFVSDNLQYAADYETVAEYVLTNCEMTNDYTPFLAEDATEDEIEEFTSYIQENYDYPAYTYDVYYDDDQNSNNEGFKMTKEEAIDYVKTWNGTDHSYFADYKGGLVTVRCNEIDKEIYEEEIK